MRPSAWNCADPVHALALERLVADREHLVHEQHVGVDVHGHRERQPDVHAGRVELHLGVDELPIPRKATIVVEARGGLLAGQAQDGRVEVDVLPAGQVGVEPGTELEQRGQPAPVSAPCPRWAAGSRRSA